MSFKNAWELVSKKLPLLGINHFFPLHKVIYFSYKGGRNPEKTKRTEVVSCCVMKGPVLHYYTHLISYSEYSVALKELSFLLCTTESLPHRRVLPEK